MAGAWGKRTNQIHNPIRNTQGTSRLNTPPNILHICSGLLRPLQLLKELSRQRRKTSNHIPTHEILRALKVPLHRSLHLQLTPPEPEIQDLLD